MLVLDNASGDGSAEMVRSLGGGLLIALEKPARQGGQRHPAAARSGGDLCLLLNEDSELQEEPRKR